MHMVSIVPFIFTFSILIHSAYCFRSFQWLIDAAGPNCNNERQASEFELFDTPDGSGGPIPYTGATFSGEGGGGSFSEYPQNLFDDNLATKDCCWVTFATVTFPQDVPNVQAYRWATANDMPCRDPVSWSVWGLDESANTWIQLDSRSVTLNLGRQTYTPVFTMMYNPTLNPTPNPTLKPTPNPTINTYSYHYRSHSTSQSYSAVDPSYPSYSWSLSSVIYSSHLLSAFSNGSMSFQPYSFSSGYSSDYGSVSWSLPSYGSSSSWAFSSYLMESSLSLGPLSYQSSSFSSSFSSSYGSSRSEPTPAPTSSPTAATDSSAGSSRDDDGGADVGVTTGSIAAGIIFLGIIVFLLHRRIKSYDKEIKYIHEIERQGEAQEKDEKQVEAAAANPIYSLTSFNRGVRTSYLMDTQPRDISGSSVYVGNPLTASIGAKSSSPIGSQAGMDYDSDHESYL